eukprot:TRINITY_DN1378_c0_g1_i3.p1 TRINITY_DN1378_c0_g1~~TRINITY_DN1378_c0_g1_i3.p1  ORF type:complete len:349 (-),score=49.92 TRINITY_DN1378_c0_g1_i3:169-1215(-)
MRTLYIFCLCFGLMLLFNGAVFAQSSDQCAEGCLKTMVGNGICESRCNVSACSYDKSDCIKDYTDCSAGCQVSMLGNGNCDTVCATFQCLYDFGDCVGGNFSSQANSNEECAKGCPISWLGDGTCDPACNVDACQNDKGDCSGSNPGTSTECATGCPSTYIRDGVCDDACNVVQCNFDGGDCGGGVIGNKNNTFTPTQCQAFPSNLQFCEVSFSSSNQNIISPSACSNSDSNIAAQVKTHKPSNDNEVQCYNAYAEYQCGIGCVSCIPSSGILPVCRNLCTNFKNQCSKVSIPGIDVTSLDCTSTLFSDTSCSQTSPVTFPASSSAASTNARFLVSAIIGVFIFYLLL